MITPISRTGFFICLLFITEFHSAYTALPFLSFNQLLGKAQVLTCDDLGFPGAILNQCGYCVEGSTGLSAAFGQDCAGVCAGKAYVDCAGICNGWAYVDECSGQCISPSYYEINNYAVTTPSSSSPKNSTNGTSLIRSRDCTGLCSLPSDNPGDLIVYVKDACGVCVAQSTLQTDNLVSNLSTSNESSIYKDCAEMCYTPAKTGMMAVINEDTCNECIGPNTKISLGSIKDACGNCKSLNLPCACPNDDVDICGVCGGLNDSCTTIISANPSSIPSDTSMTITIVGVALQSKYHTLCLFIKENLDLTGQDEYKFTAQVHDTISCEVKLDEGIYQLHLAIEENQQVKILSNASISFTVYSKFANIQPQYPISTILMQEYERNFTVHFVAQNLRRVDHILCILNGSAFDSPIKVNSSSIADGRVNCTFPYPAYSSIVNISLSLDNQTLFGNIWSVKLIAPMPRITNAYILAAGDSMVIVFNHDIDSVRNFSTCGDVLTQETTKVLGDGATCVWATKRQLIVTLGNTSSNVGNIPSPSNDVIILFFRDNVLKKENETYAELVKDLSTDFALSEEIPIAVLIGPNTVPQCGKFHLDGHQSIGVQKRRVIFQWRVSTPNNATAPNGSLTELLQEATKRNAAALVIDSAMLEIGVLYTFILTASNGITASRNRSSSSNHTIVRENNNIPTVMIEASLAHYPDMITVNKRFTFHSYLAMPECQYELYAINYRWSVSNPKVKFDIRQIAEDSYTVEPYTLPAGENITFTVTVTLNNDPNMTSHANITFKVKSSEIKTILPGGYQRTIGNESGTLVFNVSHSYFVDVPSMPLVFRWSCSNSEDNNPCFNYDPSVNDILLLNKPVTQSNNLSIQTSKLKPGSVLHFFVQSFSPLNATFISGTRSVVIRVASGSSPVLTIDSISAVGSQTEGPEFEDTVYLIPAMADVLLTANVLHSAPLESLQWFIPGFIEELQTFSVNQSLQDNHTLATLRIPSHLLVANGIYEINLTAIDIQSRSGWAVSSFMVLSPVTGCVVKVDPYEAFTMIPIVVESCSAAAYSYPLSYQVYFYYKNSFISLSSLEYHIPIEVMGPPYIFDNTTGINTDNSQSEVIFAVQVCNIMNSCWTFNSSAVPVSPANDLQAAAEHVFLMANLAKLKGDYLGCLRRRALYLFSITQEARLRFEMEFESQLAEALLCARKAASDQCNDSECFGNLFTLLMAIPIETNPSRDFVLIEIIKKALVRMDSGNVSFTIAGAQDALLLLETIYNFNTSNIRVAEEVAALEILIERILARSLHPGESTLLVDKTGNPWIAMAFSLLNGPIDVDVQQDSNQSVGLSLGQNTKSRFDNWKCQGENGTVCKGVVAEVQFFPSYIYHPIDVDNNTVSKVVGIGLWNPVTGEKLNEKMPFTLKLNAKPETLQKNLTYNCYYWDEENKQWSTSGVTTSVKNQSVFFCDSNILAIYAVIGTIPTLSPGEIAAIVIGVLLALAIIAAIAFFAYKKTRTKTMRVSMSKGYHPNVQPADVELRQAK